MLRNRFVAPVLCAAGSGLALLASAQVWARAVVAEPGLPRVAVEADGRTLAPVVAALALVGLAAAVVLLGGNRWVRALTSAVVVAAGAGVVLAAAAPLRDLREAITPAVAETVGRPDAPLASSAGSAWPWLAVLAGAVLAVAGVLALLAAPAQRPALARRYDAEVPGRRSDVRGAPHDIDLGDSDALWKALDRGDDPTDESGR